MLGIDSRVARYTWTVVAIFAVIAFAYKIRDTLFTFIIALFFAYLLLPLLQYLDKHLPGRSRAPALAIVYVLVVGLLAFAIFEIGSRVAAEANSLAGRLPELLARLNAPTSKAGLPVSLESARQLLLAEAKRQVVEHSKEILAFIPTVALKAVAAVRVLLFMILVPILSFFFLKDRFEIGEFLLSLAAEEPRRNQLRELGADLQTLLSQYMRALVLLAAIAFAAYGWMLSILKVPYAMLLAAIGFPLEFIPIVGPFSAFVVIILVSAFSGYGHLVWLVLVMAVFRMFQDYVISPRIMSSEFKLHPLVVIFGVLAGAEIGGVMGSFISVPVLAFLRIVYLRLRRRSVVPATEITTTQSRR
jgi:predicted PurR-regulated permease PerM